MLILPKTKLGKISLILIAIMPVLFFLAGFFASTIYTGDAENSIIEDILKRPLIALSALSAIISGITAFILAVISFFKQKERALLIYIPMALGALLLFFILGEFFVAH